MDRARQGERSAAEALIGAAMPYAAACARAACAGRDGAEDVLQESLLEVHCSVNRLESPEAFLPWLRAVVRHNAADHARRRAAHREVALEEAAGPAAPVDSSEAGAPLEAAERRRAVLAEFARLPEAEREMLALRHEAGLTLDGIARATGQSVRAVESRLFRARRELRRRLGKRLEA